MKKTDKELDAKLHRTGGFTLVEMLIVVAIIAILIAISIPLMNSALEKTRDAADQANERAAKACGMLVLCDLYEDYRLIDQDSVDFLYDAVKGKLVQVINGDYATAASGITPYGQCTEVFGWRDPTAGGKFKAECSNGSHVGKILELKVEYGEGVQMWWSEF